MSEYFDAIVFIDRREAKVFHFNAREDVNLVFTHHAVDDGFMASVVGSLGHAGYTLIVGPGNAKFELQTYIKRSHRDLAAQLCGIETLSEPQDGAILALAREFFRKRGHRHAVAPEFSFRHN